MPTSDIGSVFSCRLGLWPYEAKSDDAALGYNSRFWRDSIILSSNSEYTQPLRSIGYLSGLFDFYLPSHGSVSDFRGESPVKTVGLSSDLLLLKKSSKPNHYSAHKKFDRSKKYPLDHKRCVDYEPELRNVLTLRNHELYAETAKRDFASKVRSPGRPDRNDPISELARKFELENPNLYPDPIVKFIFLICRIGEIHFFELFKCYVPKKVWPEYPGSVRVQMGVCIENFYK